MFVKDPYNGKPSSRKSIEYYVSDETSSRDLHGSLYTHMFIEDLHLGIMPIGGRSKNPNFIVKIDPPSKEIEELIRLGLPTYHGEPQSLTEAVCDFIDMAAYILASYGKAYYDLVYFFTNDDKNNIEGFMIENVSNRCIKENLGFYWQLIPKEVLEHKGENLKRFVWLSKNDLLVLSIPKVLGGVRKFRRLLYDLQWLSKYTIPEFAMKDMAAQQQTKGYDFSAYRKNQETFLAKITQHLGWIARGTFTERSLEFYQMYRYLKFQKTKAILREHILHNLNKALEKIGAKMGFKAEIKLEGIPSYQDYDNYIRQLTEGSLQFSEVVKLMMI